MKPAAASAKFIFEITSTGSTTYKLTVAQNRCDDDLSFLALKVLRVQQPQSIFTSI